MEGMVWNIIFLVLAFIAALFSFGVISSTAELVAKVLFCILFTFFLLSFLPLSSER